MQYPQYIEDDFIFPDFYRVKINRIAEGLENPIATLNAALDATYGLEKDTMG